MNKMVRPSPEPGWVMRLRRLVRHGDRPWYGLILSVSILVIILVGGIGWMLWQESSGARVSFGWRFVIPTGNASWDPVNDRFQAWPFIYGTLVTSLFAILIALPISLGTAIFLVELCPSWLRTPITWLVELLAAIPSVVFGLWGIFVFLPQVVTPVGNFLASFMGHLPFAGRLFAGPIPASGVSRLGASLILSIMIIPTITAVARDVFLAIPGSQKEASLALGATRWETISRVLAPYGLSGILGAVMLGLGRALGETMAVTMVIGNSLEGSPSLLRPGYTMASLIANEFAEAVTKLHTQALIEVGLVLFVMTLLLNILARFLVWRVSGRINREAHA